jgi:hypothetical protein
MGVELIAAARQLNAGRQILPGQRFVVETEREAADLCALNFAVRAQPEEKELGMAASNRYPTRELIAAERSEDRVISARLKRERKSRRTKRQYRRRDLTAEE